MSCAEDPNPGTSGFLTLPLSELSTLRRELALLKANLLTCQAGLDCCETAIEKWVPNACDAAVEATTTKSRRLIHSPYLASRPKPSPPSYSSFHTQIPGYKATAGAHRSPLNSLGPSDEEEVLYPRNLVNNGKVERYLDSNSSTMPLDVSQLHSAPQDTSDLDDIILYQGSYSDTSLAPLYPSPPSSPNLPHQRRSAQINSRIRPDLVPCSTLPSFHRAAEEEIILYPRKLRDPDFPLHRSNSGGVPSSGLADVWCPAPISKISLANTILSSSIAETLDKQFNNDGSENPEFHSFTSNSYHLPSPPETPATTYFSTSLRTSTSDDFSPQNTANTGSPLLDITGQIVRSIGYPSAHGGFSDIWQGVWQKPSGTTKVAVKVIRWQIDAEDEKEKIDRRLRRELRVWQSLHHKHILELYGITSDFGPFPSMVCPWQENGNLSSYLDRCKAILRPFERFQILCQVADGLCYLHSFPIIHGDLTGSNILIDNRGSACLSDFGLSRVAADFHTSYLTSSIRGSIRWAAPEIYVIQDGQEPSSATMQSDVYSLGSVILQTLTGMIPYHNLRNDVLVLFELHKGRYPDRPQGRLITDDIWAFVMRCWSSDPGLRPSAEEAGTYMRRYGHSQSKET